MRNIFTTSIFMIYATCLMGQNIKINDINFPDDDFRRIVEGSTIDDDGDGELSDSEIQGVTNLNIDRGSISNLKGIEYFTALATLNCHVNNLTSLDISNNTALTILGCSTNKLPSLDVSNNTALTSLDCYINQLTNLDVSKNTAPENLDCSNNRLTSLNIQNGKNSILTYFNAEYNKDSGLKCILADIDKVPTDTSSATYNWIKDDTANYITSYNSSNCN